MKVITENTKLKEKALHVDVLLQKHYGAPFLFFSSKDALSQLVSAMLSHRTKNKTTGQAYKKLRDRFPTWEEVRDAKEKDILEVIRPVTYAEVKAPRIKNAMQYVSDANDGQLSLDFLKNMEVADARTWLEKIPGIGIKTSAAILNFSKLRLPALVVDMHHLRVAQRIGLIPPKCALDRGAKILSSYIPEDWDGQQVYDSHQGFMRHGQKVCHWQKPDCMECVVRAFCDHYKHKINDVSK